MASQRASSKPRFALFITAAQDGGSHTVSTIDAHEGFHGVQLFATEDDGEAVVRAILNTSDGYAFRREHHISAMVLGEHPDDMPDHYVQWWIERTMDWHKAYVDNDGRRFGVPKETWTSTRRTIVPTERDIPSLFSYDDDENGGYGGGMGPGLSLHMKKPKGGGSAVKDTKYYLSRKTYREIWQNLTKWSNVAMDITP